VRLADNPVEYFTEQRLDELENRGAIVEALARHPEISEAEFTLLIDEIEQGKTSVKIMKRPSRLTYGAILICRDLTR